MMIIWRDHGQTQSMSIHPLQVRDTTVSSNFYDNHVTTAPVVISQPSTIGTPDLEQLTVVITVPTINESLGEMRFLYHTYINTSLYHIYAAEFVCVL